VRTWVYRVAHNVAASHVARRKRAAKEEFVTLDNLLEIADGANTERDTSERQDLARLLALIERLKSPDREVMLLYLEDLEAAEIGEIAGLSAGAVATRIHRIKALLKRDFHVGDSHD
jgi:RNA polymerase sigma-70 factor (ECF subfamily)